MKSYEGGEFMDNEKKILEMLEQLATGQTKLEAGLAKLEAGQVAIKRDIEDIKTNQADMQADIRIIKDDISHVKAGQATLMINLESVQASQETLASQFALFYTEQKETNMEIAALIMKVHEDAQANHAEVTKRIRIIEQLTMRNVKDIAELQAER